MMVFKQGGTSLAKTVLMPFDRAKMSSGEDEGAEQLRLVAEPERPYRRSKSN